MATKTMVELRNIVKRYDQTTVVHDLSLAIASGEFITLLGPSGCGKTTTLRMIAGFEKESSGEIWLDGESVQDKPAYARNVNTVFQNYALFPHLSIYENVAFGLRVKKVPKAQIDSSVRDALKLVQLESFASRKPDQLSGGQKQRIAIARAIINNPKVLLLDEPLGALDQKLRKQMQVELKHLQQQLGITFIFVTHDQEEALTMSNRIAVMNKGRIEQIGSPAEIYDRPATRFVADFIGESNMLLEHGVTIAVRPEKTTLSLAREDDPNLTQHRVRLQERIYTGIHVKTVVKLPDGQELLSLEKTDQLLPAVEGDELYIRWRKADAVALQEEAVTS
ncbi:UNVERIFIED_CONTAM: spermidine/putrescine transport system ATP-binding protein [Brevibacillus sp. OAP136]